MPTILIVEKTGVIKESNIKSWIESDLYKKVGFKTPDGFEKAHEWTVDGTTVALYGKASGKAGQENKYDFPPPIDTTLFFGSCILTIAEGGGSLKEAQWETIYEKLFGGFEDIGSDDSDESDDDEDDELPRTKEGYVKDDFIVDSDDDDSLDSEDEEDDEEEAEEKVIVKKKKPAAKSKPKSSTKAKKLTVFEKIDTDAVDLENTLLCTDELEEELYEDTE